MKQFEVYDIQQWDGGSMHHHKFYLASKEEAEKYIAGNKYDRYDHKFLIVFDTIEEAKDNDLKTVRARVIAKLTPLERRAMGVE